MSAPGCVIRTPITAQSSVAGTRHGDVHLASGADGAWTYTLDNADADTVCAGGGGDGDRVRFVQRVRPRTGGTRSEVVVTVTGARNARPRRDWRSVTHRESVTVRMRRRLEASREADRERSRMRDQNANHGAVERCGDPSR